MPTATPVIERIDNILHARTGGMIVICAGTTGFNLTMDARYLWMHQKRVQGSHFANDAECQAGSASAMIRLTKDFSGFSG